ncbi:tail tubular protein A [Pseudomonas phage Bertil]|uniref:Tail tubular protein A n=1 Tax=Pseudomonas phage Bertil TaxID=2801385 RepID=A0A7T8EQE4_9CAUD|nr:tail tubular protein A [Pseudomonas phage Bertil]QQO90905.1 tail tubular protein A [Pseudomonas phage Strit]
MDLLKAVNLILPALGEHPVTRVDRKHPTLAVIMPVIENKVDTALMRGWWFNEFRTTLYPDSEQGIFVPTDTLAFIPDAEYRGNLRGNRLFNQETMDFMWPGPVSGVIQQRLDFEELPNSVATYVFYDALVQVYLIDIGLENVVSEWKQLAKEGEFLATNEHLRNKRHTTKKSSRYARLRGAMRG